MARNNSILVEVAVLAALASAPMMNGCAQAQPAYAPRPITIAAGDLRTALEALVQLTGVQLLYDVQAVEGLQTQGVAAAASVQDALEQLLKGTLLTTMVDSSGAVLITTRAARNEQSSALPEPQIQELEEVTVTGTHLSGVTDLPMPSLILTREDFHNSGYTEVADVLGSLPQNLGDVGRQNGGVSSVAVENNERASGVNLRGLGPQSTLVLLNGQRRATSVGGRVVDISAIPLSVIERVEVVTGGRSAIYGSDAVAGVVNIVTRRDFEGAESRALSIHEPVAAKWRAVADRAAARACVGEERRDVLHLGAPARSYIQAGAHCVLLPAGARAGDRPAAIVAVYPGLDGSTEIDNYGGGNFAGIPAHVFTERGYAVVYPQILVGPGSETGNLIDEIMDSLLPQIYAAAERGLIDPTRLAVHGNSFGGYTAAAIVTRSNLFRASIASNGMYDLVSYSYSGAPDGEVYWAEHVQPRLGAPLWEQRSRYVDNSPLFQADKIKTPMLILQGGADWTRPQAEELYVGLQRLNKPAQLAIYEGGGHWPAGWRRKQAIAATERVLEFLGRHLVKPMD